MNLSVFRFGNNPYGIWSYHDYFSKLLFDLTYLFIYFFDTDRQAHQVSLSLLCLDFNNIDYY